MPSSATIYKVLGETPLDALERYRHAQIETARSDEDPGLMKKWQEVPLTYAGRLDPMAEGDIIVLVGDECKKKDQYLGFDKEYEIEVVFGIETDTYDALGLVTSVSEAFGEVAPSRFEPSNYVGTFTQEYPPYSSKTVGGKQLHELARTDSLPEEMPTKEVTISELEVIGCYQVGAEDLKARIEGCIKLVTGNFRQNEIIIKWDSTFKSPFLQPNTENGGLFDVLKLRVKCSTGTYMRSLAHRMGKDTGTGAFALSIKRTKIFQ